MSQCGWCSTVNVGERTNCVNCAGPLPAPPGPDPGPRPDPAPRVLPAKYVRGLYFSFPMFFSMIFMSVGLLTMFIFLVLTPLLPPLFFGVCGGSLFVVIGLPFGVFAVQRAAQTKRALQYGTPTYGRVVSVVQSETRWLLSYIYDVGDLKVGGSLVTSDVSVCQHKVGDPLHVVYDPADPRNSSIWPPLPVVI